MTPQEFIQQSLKDLEVKLTEEFDRNFERKAFFDRPWSKTKLINRKGSLMARNNDLRRSINSKLSSDSVVWTSSLPYASIHNEGGTITVTHRMKKFFWYKYYEAAGKMSKKKDGSLANNKRNQNLSIEAMQWKNLALMKVGQKMTIPKRQFIGDHPQVKQAVEMVIDKNMKEFNESIKNNLKKK